LKPLEIYLDEGYYDLPATCAERGPRLASERPGLISIASPPVKCGKGIDLIV
jgi:hypothetical protein